MKVFVIDVDLCVGCYACQFVCKDEHVGNDWSPVARPQPDTGQFWMRLDEHIRGTVPKVEMHYIPNPCMHCDEPPCIPPCPIEGAVYKRDDGLVIIDSEKCTGCRKCVDACPYKAIYFNEDLNIAQKCTGCAHLLDGGEWKIPRCADACPTEAIKFGEESEFAAEIAMAEVLKPELGHKPRVYYLNIPKKFVAGTVYDPVEREVVVGARCTLSGAGGGRGGSDDGGSGGDGPGGAAAGGGAAAAGDAGQTVTDGFGDFWFRGLPDDTAYTLRIEAAGFKTKTIDGISTQTDVNLGDIPLER